MRKFLAARWEDLIMANYEVDPELVKPYIPAGTELDLDGGRCFVSLVAFMFLDTRVLGVPMPFHVNFEEVNLRFYIKRVTKDATLRGVCFIKEIVPRLAIAAVARTLYGEPYECWRMKSERSVELTAYEWSRGASTNRIEIRRGKSLGIPDEGSHEAFIIEHYWGYTDRGNGRIDEYKVEHQKWELFDVSGSKVSVDFGAVYGGKFAFLSHQEPFSMLLAKGSPVAVFKGKKLSV